MNLRVRNTVEDTPVVTLFGHLDNGSHTAKVMAEDQVPYAKYWDDEIEQVMVYIDPDPAQLDAIVKALDDGRLAFERLQDFGGTHGGFSEIPL